MSDDRHQQRQQRLKEQVDARVAAGSVWIESGHGATAPLGAARVSVVAA